MALVNSSVTDITADTLLSQSKTKIKGNDDKLLANDVAVEARLVTAEGKVGVIEGGAFIGTARWNDVVLGGTALVGGASAPDLETFQTGIKLYTFDGASTAEEVNGIFEMPHDYKEGTDIRPHIHWAPINANAGNVKWQMEYTIAANTVAFPANATISSTAAASGALKHHANEFNVISGTGRKIGDIERVQCHIWYRAKNR